MRSSADLATEKEAVRSFWDAAACGEDLYLAGHDQRQYQEQARIRYELEPFIPRLAEFERWQGRDVLEIGVGLGADHEQFVRAGARTWGVDLTERAVEHTRRRLTASGLTSELSVADAEQLPFDDGQFDLVYTWGVIHHSPDTPAAVRQIHRVLKPGGEARVMVYHTWSIVGVMLWVRYALLAGKPWTSLRAIYARHLESPGTKAYTRAQARQLFSAFSNVHIETVLTHGDLLTSQAGQRHRGRALDLARALMPRRLIRLFLPRCGLFMLIRARK